MYKKFITFLISSVFFISCSSKPISSIICPNRDYLNRFQDIPVPNDTCFNLKKSTIVGGPENWFGKVYFSSKLSAELVSMDLRERMPDTGWFLINEMQGRKILLIYEKDLRTAAIIVDRKRSGSEVFIAVAPRDQ